MRHWHVLTVSPMRERWVGYELHRSLGVDWYVPLERKANTIRGRFVERVGPLMPGYTFVADIEPTVWRDVRSTRHVVDCLRSDGEAAPLYDWEIDRIRLLEAEHNAAMADSRKQVVWSWTEGMHAMVAEGPFANIEVLLTRVRGSRARFDGPHGPIEVPTSALAPVA